MNTAKALLENRKRGVEITPTYDLWGKGYNMVNL